MSSLSRDLLLTLFDKRIESTEHRSGDRAQIRRFFDESEGDAFVEKRYSGGLSGLNERESALLLHVANRQVQHDGSMVPLASRVASLHNYGKQTVEAAVRITVRWHGFDLEDWFKLLGAGPSVPIGQAEFALAIVRAALKALRLMHLAGMVHGDIKSDNLCLPFGDLTQGEGRVSGTFDPDQLKIIDLGITLSPQIFPNQVPDLGGAQLQRKCHKPTAQGGIDRQVDAYRCAKAEPPNLEPFLQLDWRYDLWALGCMLERWPGLAAGTLAGNRRLTSLLDKLTEELRYEDESWYGMGGGYVPPPAVLPHDAWISEIDDVIGPQDKPWHFVVEGATTPSRARSSQPAPPTIIPQADGPAPPPPKLVRWPVAGAVVLALSAVAAGAWTWQQLKAELPTDTIARRGVRSEGPAIKDIGTLFTALEHQAALPGHAVQAGPERTRLAIGDAMRFTIASPIDGHLAVLFADAGQAWPTVRGGLNTEVKAGQAVQFPDGLELKAAAPAGTMRWVAVVTPKRVDWAAQFAGGAVDPALLVGAAASMAGQVTITGAGPALAPSR